jgi:hypothetical protein
VARVLIYDAESVARLGCRQRRTDGMWWASRDGCKCVEVYRKFHDALVVLHGSCMMVNGSAVSPSLSRKSVG